MKRCHQPATLFTSTIILTAFAVAGCGGGTEYEGPPRSAITGTVTVDGSPLANGTISFVADDDAKRSTTAPIADGKYSIPEGKGPNYGGHFVVISGSLEVEETPESEEESPAGEDEGVEGGEDEDDEDDEDDEEEEEEGGRLSEFVSPGNTLPSKYNSESELSADVSSASHVFDFDLTTN